MTLKSAIRAMNANEAAKRPSMCGYVMKDIDGLTEEEVAAGKCRIVFVDRSGKSVSFAVGGMDGNGERTVIEADARFVENLIADNWEIAAVKDLETSRSGETQW